MILELDGLSKSYGSKPAVDNLSLQISKGEFYALLGPNGAGKTTTVNMICGLLPPDSGSIRIKGQAVSSKKPEIKSTIGIVPQDIALYEELTAFENLMFWGQLYGISKSELKKRSLNLLQLTGLQSRAKDKIKTFSGGMKRRINIAASLMHQPEILIMDEPTVGIDPQSRLFIYDMLREQQNNGLTIIYTTHYMDEVEKMCSRVGIIDHGKIIAEGTVDQLRQNCGCHKSLIFKLKQHPEADIQEMLHQKGWQCVLKDCSIKIQSDHGQNIIPEALRIFEEHQLETESIEFEQAGLESVFLELTGKTLRE